MFADQAPLLLRLQAVVLAGLAIWLGVRSFGKDINSPGLLIALAVITLGVGVLLFAASRLIPAGALWPQAPTVLLQISFTLTSFVMLKSGLLLVGIPVALICIPTLIGVVNIRGQEHPEREIGR